MAVEALQALQVAEAMRDWTGKPQMGCLGLLDMEKGWLDMERD